MKLFQFVFLSIFLLSIAACGEDDGASSSDLQGTWTSESLTAESNTQSTVGTSIFTSDVDIVGSVLDYQVTFGESDFDASGSYTIDLTVNSNGTVINQTDSYTSVDNMGTYSVNGNEMTINGSFFTLEYNGQPITGGGGPQTVTFSISGDVLTFTQNETMTSSQSGTTSTTTIVSTSTWRRN